MRAEGECIISPKMIITLLPECISPIVHCQLLSELFTDLKLL